MKTLETLFQNEGKSVRTVTRNGELWFVAIDVASALGYAVPNIAISDHCKGAVHLKRIEAPSLTKSNNGIMIISERDVYRLLLRSQLPSAERFKAWVIEEFLLPIRETENSMKAEAPEVDTETIGSLKKQIEALTKAVLIASDTIEALKASERLSSNK